MPSPRSLILLGAVSSVISGVLLIVAVATIGWAKETVDLPGSLPDVKIGLFKFCFNDGCHDIDELPNFPDSRKAVAGLIITAIVFSFDGAFFGVLSFVKGRKFHLFATCFLALVCVLSLIGCIVFKADTMDTFKIELKRFQVSCTLDYSFGLAIAGGVLALINGGLIFFGGRKLAQYSF